MLFRDIVKRVMRTETFSDVMMTLLKVHLFFMIINALWYPENNVGVTFPLVVLGCVIYYDWDGPEDDEDICPTCGRRKEEKDDQNIKS